MKVPIIRNTIARRLNEPTWLATVLKVLRKFFIVRWFENVKKSV